MPRCCSLLSRVIERGIRRGEFRDMDITSVVHGLIAPAQFLILYRQCTSVCSSNPAPLDPQRFMHTQIDLILQGLERPGAPTPVVRPTQMPPGATAIHPESGGSS